MKLDKVFPKLTKKTRKRNQINKVISERRNITANTTEI